VDSLEMMISDSESSSEQIVEKTSDLNDFYLVIKEKYESVETGGGDDDTGDDEDDGDGSGDTGTVDPFDDGTGDAA